MADETKVEKEAGAIVAATRESLMRLRHTTPREAFDVPGLGRVWVYGLKHLEAKAWHEANRKLAEDGPDPYSDARMLIKSVRDEAGVPLFKEGDELLLVEWPEYIVQKILSLCMQVNGLSKEADEGLRKNFEKILTSSS